MQNLTLKQKEAVENKSPTTMVIAGPGTGKTHILASRIEYLIKTGTNPENVLALTFTESAAHEMKERVVSLIGQAGYKTEINTFHGFASSLLDEYPEIFGYRRDLQILKDIDRAKIIKEILKNLKLHYLTTQNDQYFYYEDIKRAISTLKKEGYGEKEFQKILQNWEAEFLSIDEEEKTGRSGNLKIKYQSEEKKLEKNKELLLIYKEYEQALKDRNLYDYDDMIIKATHGLKNSNEIKSTVHEKFKAILVDEYQDTSGAQNKLLFEIISSASSIFIVGDDDQAIYKFQGATSQNFIEFINKFPKTEIIVLEDNFRSPQFLINSALAIAEKNKERVTKHLSLPAKKLRALGEFKEAQELHIYRFENNLEEHAYLIDQILKLRKDGASWQDIAVITRKNSEQKQLQELFIYHNIPTSISADKDVLKEPHIISLFDLAQACIDPHNNESMLAFLRHPATPILQEDFWFVLSFRGKYDSIYIALSKLLKNKKDGFCDFKSAQKTFYLIHDLSENSSIKSGAHWLYELAEKTGFISWVLRHPDAPYIIADIKALTDEAKRIQAGNPYIKIPELLEHFKTHYEMSIPLKPTLSKFAFENTVRVMTAHNVKGQEFKNVFIVHAVSGLWSETRNWNKLSLPKEIPSQTQNEEDERRVFYVALTRAKHKVFVSYAKNYINGVDGTREHIEEKLPASLVKDLEEFVPAKIIKKEIEEFLMQMSKDAPDITPGQKEIIKGIVTNPRFALNATSLNSFLECPNKFLYEKILNVPTILTFSLTYGNAMHKALERYFQIKKELRNINTLFDTVARYIDTISTLTEGENEKLFKRAEKTLAKYYEKVLQHETDPMAVEYQFKRGEIEFEGVRITGKIDKISLLDLPSPQSTLGRPGGPSNVRIVDYKTNKKAPSLNQVLGKTKDKKYVGLLRQLLFYKLLAECAENFKYEPKIFSLDFIEIPKEITVELTDEMYSEFKKTIKKAWQNIQTLKFLKPNKEFPTCGKCKYCNL